METSSSVFSYIPIFFPAFIAIYLIAYFGVFRHWSSKHRPEAASCFISLAHGSPVAIMALYAIISQSQPGFTSPNTNFQNLILDFSTSYFLVDLLHYINFFPSDFLFIAHHLATLFVILTCRYLVSHGAFAILVLLVLAEVTSACQNTWTLANVRRGDVPAAAKLYEFLSPPFYAFYTLVRGFAGPVFLYRMGVFYISGEADNVIPRWVSLSWLVVVGAAILASILWVLNLWVELYKQRMAKGEKKAR